MGSGGGRGKGRARGAPADPPARPCAPHGCNENTVTGTLGVARRDKGRHRGTRGDIEEGGTLHVAWGPNGEGDPRFWGLGEQLRPSQGSRGLICTQLCVPALPRLLPASFQYKLPPPSTFPRQAPPHLHTDHASNATNPAPWFTYRPRPPALHTAPPPSPSPSPHGFASSNAPPGSHLHTGHTPSPLVLPSPSFAYGGPAPPFAPPTWGPCAAPSAQTNCTKSLSESCPWW